MTKEEALLVEFSAAIKATLGDEADEEVDVNITSDQLGELIDPAEIDEIARKVKFYIFD